MATAESTRSRKRFDSTIAKMAGLWKKVAAKRCSGEVNRSRFVRDARATLKKLGWKYLRGP